MARNDGKALERLVAAVEALLLPPGMQVKRNHRVYDADGVQHAEFDVYAHGNVGSGTFSWLLQCRDRPSGGPCGVEWIRELIGTRDSIHVDRVTAVSTTGFTAPAIAKAKAAGIELREIEKLDPIEFGSLRIPITLEETQFAANLQNVIFAFVDSAAVVDQTHCRCALMRLLTVHLSFARPAAIGPLKLNRCG